MPESGKCRCKRKPAKRTVARLELGVSESPAGRAVSPGNHHSARPGKAFSFEDPGNVGVQELYNADFRCFWRAVP